VLEIVWHVQNDIVSPRCYSPTPAKFLTYPTQANEADRLMLSPNGYWAGDSQDFPPDKFIIAMWTRGSMHPFQSAKLRPLARHWLAAIYGLGWLMQYCQLYGIPWRHVTTDGTEDANSRAAQMLATIGAQGYAVTSQGVELSILEGVSGSGESLPQSHMIEVADRTCDILLLGQTLTSDNTGTGSRALGEVHAGIRADVLQDVASWVASIITEQIIPAIVRFNFGAVAAEDMPYAELRVPSAYSKEDAERIQIVKDLGVEIPRQWAHETLGVPMPADGDEIIGGESGDESTKPVTQPQVSNDTMDDDEEEDLTDEPEIEAARADSYRPTEEMASNARLALEVRRAKPASQRGMTAVGLARARDIANRVELPPDTVKRMVSFFARHEVDKKGSTWDEQGKGWQAWNGWGGDAGMAWANRLVNQIDK
jgi:hypothetical protein